MDIAREVLREEKEPRRNAGKRVYLIPTALARALQEQREAAEQTRAGER